jgi:hypothetical protein
VLKNREDGLSGTILASMAMKYIVAKPEFVFLPIGEEGG